MLNCSTSELFWQPSSVCLQAASVLGSIQDPELQHKPAVLATCLSLLEQQGNVAGAISRVQEGLDWWQNSMTADKASQAAAVSWLQQQMVHLQLKVQLSIS